MAPRRASVKLTANFEANLGQLEAFLLEADAAPAYDALLSDLETTVIPNLETFPRMGRPFFERSAGSVEAHAKIERLALRLGQGELREYLSGEYLLLYAFRERTVYLLSIKHHRQLSFDFARLSTESH
jgi:plasmid stabilization system protein ParE